jgi:hypothetical protein
MKKMKLFSVVGMLFAGASAFAANDQYVEVEAFSVVDNGQIAKFKSMCDQIGKDANARMDAFLAANPDLEVKDVNVSSKYEIQYDYRGGVMTASESMQRIQYCYLRVRLNNDSRKLSLGKSEVYFTGRGKRKPCLELKKEIDQNVNVIYSELNNNLFRCNIKPIISIDKK